MKSVELDIKSEYDIFDRLKEEKIVSRYFCVPCNKDPHECGHQGTPAESYHEYLYKCKLCGIEIKITTQGWSMTNDIKDHFYRHLDDGQKIKVKYFI